MKVLGSLLAKRSSDLEFGWFVLSKSARAGYSPPSGELTSDTDSLLRGCLGWPSALEVLSVDPTHKAYWNGYAADKQHL